MATKRMISAANLIRDDHARVLRSFHSYRIDFPCITKRALVDNICLELEVHAQIEEEIFYPAVSIADPAVMDKNVPEHDEMRRLILLVRSSEPTRPDYDLRFMQLMRSVLHHAVEEETTLLPVAETLLRDRMQELGAHMAERRGQLMPAPAQSAPAKTARSVPGIFAGVAMSGFMMAYAVGHGIKRAITPRI